MIDTIKLAIEQLDSIGLEVKLSKEKKEECRTIIKEIKNFGVNQRQILFLIELLSMELEDTSIMKSVVGAIKENREKIPVIEEVETKIILEDK